MHVRSLLRVVVVSGAALTGACGPQGGDENVGEVSQAVATITTDKASYTNLEIITITYGDVPPSVDTWFTMAPAGSPDTSIVDFRWNENASAAGTFQFGAPQTAGSYVVRVFQNHSYELVVESAAFTVGAGSSGATVDAPAIVQSGLTFNVTFAGFPPSDRNWIAVANAGAPATSYLYGYFTPAAASGTMFFPAPTSAGNYEIRAYFNYDAVATRYVIQASDPFSVQGQTERVSVSSAGAEGNAAGSFGSVFGSISTTGQYVAFASDSSNLVAGDTNAFADIFRRDRSTGTTIRVNVGPGGVQSDGGTDKPRVSNDGRYVVFNSRATNLTAVSDPSFNNDIFLHDTQTGTTEFISLSTSGGPGDGESIYPSVSDDGRFVAFGSFATNIVAGDTNANWDMFVRDRTAGTTVRASVGSFGEQANGASRLGRISANGAYVAFVSDAPGLVPSKTSSFPDVFLRWLTSPTTELISIATSGEGNSGADGLVEVSPSGQMVLFRSNASNLVAGDTNNAPDLFLRDRSANTLQRVNVGPGGAQADAGVDTEGYGISDNLRYVVYSSDATTLVTGDTNGVGDVFRYDLWTATTVRVSVDAGGAQGNGRSWRPLISGDGLRTVFESAATNVVAGDTNGRSDVFVRLLP